MRTSILLLLITLLPMTAEAQGTATVNANAPIYLNNTTNLGPFRVAAPGTVLKVLKEDGDWLQVQFNDPTWGVRVGWVQRKLVNYASDALKPMDLSITKEPSPARSADVTSPERAEQVPAATATSAAAQGKSRSMGFFVDGGFEGASAVTEGNEVESGAGVGVTLGYGFTRQLALYGHLGTASLESVDGFGNYGMGQFDIGLRVHFRAPANTVVPFVQFGLSGRAMAIEILGETIELSGAGFAFGAGLNAHFTPAVAFTTSVVWSIGTLSSAKVDGDSVPYDSIGLTTARVHFGIIWFPQAK